MMNDNSYTHVLNRNEKDHPPGTIHCVYGEVLKGFKILI